ncbi:hypothetical protein [Mesorhizobium sp. M1403]
MTFNIVVPFRLFRIRQGVMAVQEKEHRAWDAMSPMGEAFGDGE